MSASFYIGAAILIKLDAITPFHISTSYSFKGSFFIFSIKCEKSVRRNGEKGRKRKKYMYTHFPSIHSSVAGEQSTFNMLTYGVHAFSL